MKNTIFVYKFEKILQKKNMFIFYLIIIGPLSDHGRKLLMYLVFLGHALSGGFALAFIYFKNWPSQYLWVLNIYNIFGGYPVVRIAMYGYIGDVTTNRLVLVIIIFQL